MWDFRGCAFCHLPPSASLGPLLGPLGPHYLSVHRPCALWSPEVHETEDGTLFRVLEAIRRGQHLKCSHCGKRGATVGCRVDVCNKTYHVHCANEAGCSFYLNHCVACRAHARRFDFAKEPRHLCPLYSTAPVEEEGQQEVGESDEAQYVTDIDDDDDDDRDDNAGNETENERNKRRRIEIAHLRRVRAKKIMATYRQRQRKHATIENKAKTMDSDDEEHFAKREAARLQRDVAKLHPITLSSRLNTNSDGTKSSHVYQSIYVKPKNKEETTKTDAPTILQATETAATEAIRCTDFSDLAGLDDVITSLQEMVLLPLQYPEVFQHQSTCNGNANATMPPPPRGILFHGFPGTGKTLAARALAGECAKRSPVPITFFSRKGADCLGKFVGEAERTLRLLFEEASKRAPSIIFLDELDALVPVRHGGGGGGTATGGGHQDQIHATVVSTLLSLMDGVADRGHVVVIGATNRPEDIDSALRRPGRFDREVFFGLPSTAQRKAILTALTRRWEHRPSTACLNKVAAETEGWAGADLSGLCTAVVMGAARVTVRTPATATMIQIGDEVWEEALAQSPLPSAQRHATAHCLSRDCQRPVPYCVAPLVLPTLVQVLCAVGKSVLPLPPPVQAAVDVCRGGVQVTKGGKKKKRGGGGGGNDEILERVLMQHGAIEQPPQLIPQQQQQEQQEDDTALPWRSLMIKSPPPPLRILISGEHANLVSGAVLRLFGASCSLHVIHLPALAVAAAEGGSDATATTTVNSSAVVFLLKNAFSRANPRSTLVLYCPQIESWAGEVVSKEGNGGGDVSPSQAWMTFQSMVEQASSRQPILILASSRQPLPDAGLHLLSFFTECITDAPQGVEGISPTSHEKEGMVAQIQKRVHDVAVERIAREAAHVYVKQVNNKKNKSADDENTLGVITPSPALAPPPPPSTSTSTSTNPRLKSGLNIADWEHGQRLFSSVYRFIITLGSTMARDRRCFYAGTQNPLDTGEEASMRVVMMQAAAG